MGTQLSDDSSFDVLSSPPEATVAFPSRIPPLMHAASVGPSTEAGDKAEMLGIFPVRVL